MQSKADTGSPRRMGRYELVRPIGKGGMGTVYEAYHPILKKRFAIKTLLETAAAVPGARARFLREAEAAARISHPNVVHVTDVGSEGATPYLVMEYLEGETLAELLAARGRLDVPGALDILLPVLSAVAAAHALGVIHRDLKPENIFLARTPLGEICPKVVDFGVSKLTDAGPSTLTGPQATLGTAAYMSPEQARGAREVGAASDQYSLGLILYETIGGRRAHPGQNALEILHNISRLGVVRLRHLQPDCPQPLEDAVMRMLSPAPEYRFPSVAEAGAALLGFATEKTRGTLASTFEERGASALAPEGAAPGADRSELPTQPAAEPRRRVRVAAAVLVGLALAAGLLFWAWPARRAEQPPPPAPPATGAQAPALAPVIEPLMATPAAPAAEAAPAGAGARAPMRRGRSTAAPAAFPGSHDGEKVFDPRMTAPRPGRGVNDALIIE